MHRHLPLCVAAALLAACSPGSDRRADSAAANAPYVLTPQERAGDSAATATVARAREAAVPGKRDTLIVQLERIELRVGDTLDLATVQVHARGADGADAGEVPLSYEIADQQTAAIRPLLGHDTPVLVGLRAGRTELRVTTPVFARGAAGTTVVPLEVKP
ncbi:MAG TPA: hypothetical protein VFS05_11105 [Gemmatimonadaceae bacterium]|nr:hypothetical protein [Gemmatimonadaceae bacterium]